LTASAVPRMAVSETPGMPIWSSIIRCSSPTDWLHTGQTGA
jgi:hypothetical protein